MATAASQQLVRTDSRDGTAIGYWSSGTGPPLVLVHGLLGDHARWDQLRPFLEAHFTVHALDRRGRGASGDAADYDFEREVGDVAAAVEDVRLRSGRPVNLMGSSGGALYSLAAAALSDHVRRLVLFEPPSRELLERLPAELLDRLDQLLAAGERQAVLEVAYRHVAGLSDAEIEQLKAQPAWPHRIAAAHTVPRELRVSPDRVDAVLSSESGVPTLVLAGGSSPPPFRQAAERLAKTLPQGRLVVLEGQAHAAEVIAPEPVAQAVVAFLQEGDG
jgi:pimeloyl-ACP methyl ester carboxylesterase